MNHDDHDCNRKKVLKESQQSIDCFIYKVNINHILTFSKDRSRIKSGPSNKPNYTMHLTDITYPIGRCTTKKVLILYHRYSPTIIILVTQFFK